MARRLIAIIPALAILALVLTQIATQAGPGELPEPLAPDALAKEVNKYASVDIGYDESVLSEAELKVLRKLVEAGHLMDEIFFLQVWAGNAEMRQNLMTAWHDAKNDPKSEWAGKEDVLDNIIRFYKINFSPWNRLEAEAPFLGTAPKPAGANYYPEDMTKEEFEAHITANPEDEEAFRSFFTAIRRKDGSLVAVPYSTEYKDLLEKAAALLHDAAEILTRPENRSAYRDDVNYTTLARFLKSRADAFSSNDYIQSDMDWMDVEENIIDVTIGPYEVYEDQMNGYKAAFEAFIAIRHPEDSRKLAAIKNYMQLLENSLPLPDEHKNPNRGSESPVSVVDLVFAGGDTKAGVQTIAFNLPNDETVREAKGSKKVMLKNITQAKFEKIMIPIAQEMLDPDQMDYLDFDAYFNNVLMHEIAHGLGPGKLQREDGSETTVGRELKELYAPIEECKADILGLFCRKVLIAEGFFPEEDAAKGYVSFLPGFFRAIRFGASSAHGRANMIEFNFMAEKGAIEYDKKKERFHVHIDKMPAAVEALAHELLMIEALGDYDAAKAFLDKYATMTPELERLLGRLTSIPVDIDPKYSAEKYLGKMDKTES